MVVNTTVLESATVVLHWAVSYYTELNCTTTVLVQYSTVPYCRSERRCADMRMLLRSRAVQSQDQQLRTETCDSGSHCSRHCR
jgi:hypothetical protein